MKGDPTAMVTLSQNNILEWRSMAIKWLFELHLHLNLPPATIFLTVNIIDRFLSKHSINEIGDVKLVAAASMYIASKVEGLPRHHQLSIRIMESKRLHS